MPNPYRIVDLQNYTLLPNGLPSGGEVAEISNGGNGSFQVPISVLAYGRVPNTVNAGGTFNLVAGNYGDVLVTTSSAVTVQLPTSVTRGGVPASVIAQTTSTPNITILPFGSETIMGQPSLKIANSYGAFTLWPLSSGGWYQK